MFLLVQSAEVLFALENEITNSAVSLWTCLTIGWRERFPRQSSLGSAWDECSEGLCCKGGRGESVMDL